MIAKLKELFIRHLGTVIFTVVEVVGLVTWFALAGGALSLATYSGQHLAAVIVLFVFLVVEHVLAFNVIGRRPLLRLDGTPVGRIALFSGIETVIWVVWLVLTGVQVIVAAVVLAAALVVEHNLSDNVAKGRPLFSGLLDTNTVVISVVEAGGATAWFLFVGAGRAVVGVVVLAVASFIEHRLLVRLGRRFEA